MLQETIQPGWRNAFAAVLGRTVVVDAGKRMA
jgi:hypothetical protein